VKNKFSAEIFKKKLFGGGSSAVNESKNIY
jgi:hypothetical protein